MFYRVGVPLIVVGILALILLVWVLIYRRRRGEFEEEKELNDELSWSGICPVSNPETGAECQRVEFHNANHYRVVNGKMITWP